jgi:hypothetical protein
MLYGWSDYDVADVPAKAGRARPAFLMVVTAEGSQRLRETEMRNGARILFAILNV